MNNNNKKVLKEKRARDYGIIIGDLPCGPYNRISDVQGVRVGHVTLNEGPIKTGLTAILPHGGNIFQEKVLAASHVINGFGKSVGLIQIDELGTIETPILLTNTLSVGTVYQGLVEYMLLDNPQIGFSEGTVNPVVGECNDGYLNDIRASHIRKEHVQMAIARASKEFLEGSIGAGTGMSCYGLKGGIGTASRLVDIGQKSYTLGLLVLTNFGQRKDLILNGKRIGSLIEEKYKDDSKEEDNDKGSIIVIMATDLPLSSRQLKRLSKRAVGGISRTGSYLGHGSGDIVIAFSTARKIPHTSSEEIMNFKFLHESYLNLAFRATVEAVEEAIINSLFSAEGQEGVEGHYREPLKKYLDIIL